MLLVVLLLVSKAGAVCVGGPQELRTAEVLVMCPLSEDARLSRRSVVITHSRHNQSNPDTILGCDWLARHSHKPDCSSRFHFTLVSLKKDCVTARVPRAQLRKDNFYQCQLVPPPDADHAFSRCLVFDNDDTEDSTTTLSPVIPAADQPWPRDPMENVLTGDTEDPSTTISPVIPSTADDLRHPGNDKEKVSTSADGCSPRGNSAAYVALSVSVFILIVLNVGLFAYIFLLHRIHWISVQWVSEISRDTTQKSRKMMQWTSNINQEQEPPPRLQGNVAMDVNDLPGDGKADSVSNHSNSFEDNGAGDCRELPGDGATANILNANNIDKMNGVTDVGDLPGDEEPMYGITPTVLREFVQWALENSRDLKHQARILVYWASKISQEMKQQKQQSRMMLSKTPANSLEMKLQPMRTVSQTSETSVEIELQPMLQGNDAMYVSDLPGDGTSVNVHYP